MKYLWPLRKTTTICYLAIFLITSLKVYADRGGNGGSVEQARLTVLLEDYTQKMLQLRVFFEKNKNELKLVFPEIYDYDLFLEYFIPGKTTVLVTDDIVSDRYAIPRTCVNYPEKRKIICNSKKLLELSKHQTTYYVLVLHEIFGLLEMEVNSPQNAHFIDGYVLSKRIAPFVRTMNNQTRLATNTEFIKYDAQQRFENNSYYECDLSSGMEELKAKISANSTLQKSLNDNLLQGGVSIAFILSIACLDKDVDSYPDSLAIAVNPITLRLDLMGEKNDGFVVGFRFASSAILPVLLNSNYEFAVRPFGVAADTSSGLGYYAELELGKSLDKNSLRVKGLNAIVGIKVHSKRTVGTLDLGVHW